MLWFSNEIKSNQCLNKICKIIKEIRLNWWLKWNSSRWILRNLNEIFQKIHYEFQWLTNGNVDILYGSPRLTQTRISRLAQEPCEGVCTGQVVCDGTRPCVLTTWRRGLGVDRGLGQSCETKITWLSGTPSDGLEQKMSNLQIAYTNDEIKGLWEIFLHVPSTCSRHWFLLCFCHFQPVLGKLTGWQFPQETVEKEYQSSDSESSPVASQSQLVWLNHNCQI